MSQCGVCKCMGEKEVICKHRNNAAVKNTCTMTTSSLSPDISVGDFVAVKLSAGKGYKIYMAEVLELEEDGKESHLKYMKKCRGDLNVWPNPIDKSWEPTARIICTVGYPELMNNREQFRFSATDMA